MARWALVIASLAALVAAGYVLFEPVERERHRPKASAQQAESDERARLPGGPREAPPPPLVDRPPDRALADCSDPTQVAPPAPVDPDPNRVKTGDEARAEFEAMIDRLDDVAKSGKTLTAPQKEALYRQSTHAYANLSNFLDARDPAQSRHLDESRALLLAKLRLAGAEPAPPSHRPSRQRPPIP